MFIIDQFLSFLRLIPTRMKSRAKQKNQSVRKMNKKKNWKQRENNKKKSAFKSEYENNNQIGIVTELQLAPPCFM